MTAMKGITLTENEQQTQLLAIVDTLVFNGPLDQTELESYVIESGFSNYRILSDNVLALSEDINIAATENRASPIESVIGEANRFPLKIDIPDDQMSANLIFTKAEDSKVPTLEDVREILSNAGVKVGISQKRIRAFLHSIVEADIGAELSEIIARGLPARNGKDSYIKPLVPNALERVLAPQLIEGDKVDMRDLGEIISVSPNQEIAKRIPPTKGRYGKTVKGTPIESETGSWKPIQLGDNTMVSPNDTNLIIAKISGQPKFDQGIMNVDDTFITNGVNVGTGNIKYDGAVVVNGDVKEHMEIIAKGDVTINGFVESALIRTDGDIIITEGATGKMHDEDCRLIAKGNIFIQHAQGLDVVVGKNLTVAKQLAYSRVKCEGMIIVGSPDNPNGNLFASNINCYGSVKAGSIGAVSGSALSFDYSEGFNLLTSRLEVLHKLYKDLSTNNANHELQISAINNKHIPEPLAAKLESLNNELEKERTLLTWLREAQTELENRIKDYQQNARIIANKELFPGVSVKFNKQTWKGEKEYQRCRLVYEDGEWHHDPMI